MKKLILILIIGVLLISCKKERTIHITAKNAVTGTPYPGLRYQVIQEWSGSFKKKYSILESGELDENGEAYFNKKLPKDDVYRVIVDGPENSCYVNDIGLFNGGETNFEAAFEFAECANLNLNIHNVNCQDSTDVMRFRAKYSFSDWEGWSTKRIGCYDFDSPDYFEVPQGTRMYQWEVIRNGVKTTYNGSISLNIGESGTFVIEY